jgi:hypothetical protein
VPGRVYEVHLHVLFLVGVYREGSDDVVLHEPLRL